MSTLTVTEQAIDKQRREAVPDRSQEAHRGSHRGFGYRRTRGTRQSLEGPPTAEELAQHAERHKGEDADRFSLYTPEQITEATKPARLFMAFDEPIKIRDQAEMIIAAMQIIIGLTKKHDLGSTNQRIEARREAAMLGQKLSLFNGKTPYGFRKKLR